MKKGERLKRLIEESPYKNVSQFSKAAGVPYTTVVSFIDRDLHKAGVDNVFKVAKTLNVSVDYLISDEVHCDYEVVKESQAPCLVNEGAYNDYHYMPASISAGLPLDVEAITESETIKVPDSVMGKWAGDKEIFFSRINGDSMDRIMPDKSLIAIKPIDKESLKNGDIVVFSNDHDYSVKYFYKQPDKLIFKPHSFNIEHHEQHYNTYDNIVIHGKVVLYIVELD